MKQLNLPFAFFTKIVSLSKMLKQLLIIFFIWVNCTTNSAFAQDTTKTKFNKWGVCVSVNNYGQREPFVIKYFYSDEYGAGNNVKNTSYSLGAAFHYNLNESLRLHIYGGISNRKLTSHNDSRNSFAYQNDVLIPQDGYELVDDITKQKIYNYALGFSKNIFKNKNFDFHCGFDALMIFYRKWERDYSTMNVDSVGATTQYQNATFKGGDAFSAGISSFIGFDLRVYKNIFIGADFSDAFLYTKIYGEQTQTATSTAINPPSTVMVYIDHPNLSRFGFSNIGASFNLTFKF